MSKRTPQQLREQLAGFTTKELKQEVRRRGLSCTCLAAARHPHKAEQGNHHDIKCERFLFEPYTPPKPAPPPRPRSRLLDVLTTPAPDLPGWLKGYKDE